MVTRLRPLEITMLFEERSYKLGETIDIDLELTSRRDVLIREGRVDLMCQELYKQTTTVTYMEDYAKRNHGFKKLTKPYVSFTDNRQITRTRNETYSHSGEIFLTNARLFSGATSRHTVRLKIGLEPPEHISDSTVTEGEVPWAVVAAFDLAQARDATQRQPIRVASF